MSREQDELLFQMEERRAPFAPVTIKPAPAAPASAKPQVQPSPASAASTPPHKTMRSTPPAPASLTMSDFRRNAERQSREQKTVGNFLTVLVYCVIGGVVLLAGLAAYGAHVIYGQLRDQSATMAQLNDRFNTEAKVLHQQLDKTQQDIDLARQVGQKQQASLARQQEQVAKLSARVDDLSDTVRSDRQTIADLRRRSTAAR